MPTITLSEIRDRVRFIGSFENSTKFTTARLNVEINSAWSELYELLEDAHAGFWDTTGTLTTTANQQHVDLPANFWVLKGADILVGGKYEELDQIGITDRNSYQSSSGRPVAFRTATGGAAGRLLLFPTPSAVESLRIVYTPAFTELAADGDTVQGWNSWDDYIVYATLLRCMDREQTDAAPTERRLAQISARIVKAASKRRSSAPQHLVIHGYELDDWDYL